VPAGGIESLMALLFRLVLIFVVIAGSVVMAPARGQMVELLQITICADGGAQTLTLDARGNPVGAHHPCPDCTTCLATGPPEDAGSLHRAALGLSMSYPLSRGGASAGTVAIHPTARDPPRSV